MSVYYENGNEITSTSSFALINPIRYRGYYYDSETGFYYLKSRYYDPANCRFISTDGQLDFQNGTTNLNLFAYCGNDPVNRVDPNGHSWLILAAFTFVALCATSCSDSPEVYPELPPTKTEPTFSSIKDAAIHAANEFYSFTKYSGKEYGAAIYKNSDEDCYRLTSTSRGDKNKVSINTSEVKDGEVVGYVHSHPHPTTSKFSNGDFSFDPEKRLEYYVVEPIKGKNYGELYQFSSATPATPITIVKIFGRELTYDEKNLYRP